MSATSSFPYCLRVETITLDVRLGCEPDERVRPQRVHVQVRVYFPALPKECLHDSGDFICYDAISQRLKKLTEGREFRLIEYFATECFVELRQAIPMEAKLWVQATKVNVPVEFVEGGASFTYTDLPPGAWTVPQ